MILSQKNKAKYLYIALVCFMATGATAQQYGWRGINRDGAYNENGLMKIWPVEGPAQLWETIDIGKGYSSPVITATNLYITGMNEDESKETFSAYTLDGKRIYQIEYGSPWNKSYPETRTTPSIVGEKAYVISGMGEIVCINITNGNIIWKVDGAAKFGRKTGMWGTSESPLIFDNKIIFSPGGEQTAIIALNTETGELIWQSKSLDDISNYTSPLLITHNGKKQIVTITGNSVIGINPDNGNIVWTFNDWGQAAIERGREKISPNTPLYKNGQIFVCNGYDMGSFMLQLNDDASNIKLLWRNNDIDTHHGGFVLKNGIIYGSNWISNNNGNWVAVDWETGETKYEHSWGSGKGKGSIITADDMLICYDERRGTVEIGRAHV